MHVVVLGAGVTGTSTAYYLSESGHEVTLVDRGDSIASATSYANGGQLSYSYTDSLARPEFLPKIPGLALGLDPAIHIGVFRNYYLAKWGLSFLAQCTHRKARANTLAVLDIALRSAALLEELLTRVDIEFAHRHAGKLVLLKDKNEIAGARERAAVKREHGCETQIIGAEEALSLEPALAAMTGSFAAAIYSVDDEVGDAMAFSAGLASWLQEHRGLAVRLGETVQSMEVSGSRLRAVHTDAGVIEADAAVVCLGPWSRRLLLPHGIDPQIYPVRGYSVTLPAAEHTPSVSVTHLAHRIVFSQLGDRVRIAGFADFVGYETHKDKRRLERMLAIARQVAPAAADYDAGDKHAWGGFRPVTPSSRPVVGPTPIDGLYLNTGHGVLGWTLACATAKDVAAAISA